MLTLLAITGGLAVATPSDDWRFFRHDAQNTARSAAVGRMVSAPKVLARYQLGGRPQGQHLAADLDNDGVAEIVTTSGGPVAAFRPKGPLLWRNLLSCGRPYIVGVADLDADGWAEIVASSGPPATLYILSGRDGRLLWQRTYEEQVYFENGTRLADLDGDGRPDLFLMGNAPAENSRRIGWALTFPRHWREPKLLWGPLDLHFNPHYRPQTIVADMDGDGRPEVVVSSAGHVSGKHLCVSVFDGRTGELRRDLAFPNGDRNYGHLQAVRTADKPQLDLLVVGMLGKPHVTFLVNEDQGLREAWHANDTIQVCDNPVADVDGDGALEVVTTRITDTGEEPTAGNVAIVVRDLLTGRVKQELPGLRLQGLADLDGDGRREMIATTVPGGEVILYAGTTRQRPLGVPGACPCLVAPPPPLNIMNEVLPDRSGFNVVFRDLNGDGRSELLVSTPQGLLGVSPVDGATRFVVRSHRGVVPRVIGWGAFLPGGREALLGLTDDGLAVVGLDGAARGAVRVQDCAPRPVVAARLQEGGGATVFATRPGSTVVALDGRALAKGRTRVLWQRPGLGAFDAPTVADVDGDGRLEIVLCNAATAEPTILDANGEVRTVLPALPTDGTALSTGTCAVGHFGPGGRVYLGALSNVGPNDGQAKWTMYDPVAAAVVWQREGGPHERRSSCVWDVDGDGCDDLVHSHFFDVIALKGTTGETLWYINGSVPGYHLATIADLDGSGSPSLLLSGGYMAIYRFDLRDRKEIWRTPPLNYNAGSAAALGDVDGDGRLEFGTAFTDRFDCYDAATGKAKWSLPLAGKGTDVAACDVNGDGRDEFLFGGADGSLYAVGATESAAEGRVVWRVDLGAPVGPPSVADLDGDGLAEVLVITTDGWLYALGGA